MCIRDRYKNSLIITVVRVALALFLSACVGYGFAMYNFNIKGKKLIGNPLRVTVIENDLKNYVTRIL